MENKIEVGDLVKVDFNGSQYTLTNFAIVLSIPAATGDSWVFKTTIPDPGHLYYVSEGCTIELLEKAPHRHTEQS